MEKLFILLVSIMSLTLVGCSGQKTSQEAGNTGVELTDADEFLEDEAGDVVAEQAQPVDSFSNDEVASSEPIAPVSPSVQTSSELNTYTVQKNETLMLIAFKIYGDYSKWKELAQLNSGVNIYKLKEGQTIQYYAPVNEFVWSPVGNPYLIKSGDTLGTISNDTYGTNKYWKDIWSNNKPLIKDPNKIFVGFTIYTPVLENREVASQL